MSKVLKFYIIICLSTSFLLNAQTAEEKKINTQQNKELGHNEPAEPTENYKEAERLVDLALSKLKEGEVNEANEFIKSSIAHYPTIKVFDFVRQVCLMSDSNGANAIMDQLYAKVSAMDDPEILVLDRTAVYLINGVRVKQVRWYDSKRVLYRFASERADMNKEFGSFSQYIESMKVALSIKLRKKKNVVLDIESFSKLMYEIMVAKLEKNYDSAIRLTETANEAESVLPSVTKQFMLLKLYIDKGDYEAARKIAAIDTEPAFYGYRNRFVLFTALGDYELAMENYARIYELKAVITNDLSYSLSLLWLLKKEYQKSLDMSNYTLNHKLTNTALAGSEGQLYNKYEVYKAKGDAYVGLKQFEKAKDFYNLSLLLYPDYEPAAIAMAKLESNVATTTATDKTAPTIIITEPATNRGLEIVSAGNDILVKGTAADPSGLKSVTINEQSIYAQPDGNFWGNIALKDGINKISIKATDGAGNISEHAFDIDKKATASEIVPVVSKEGKNYCLLIGAQNYADSSIPSLENPIQDAVRLKIILKSDYDFEDSNIITLFNPEANDIKRQLLELSNIIQPEDNLLIFYAGHGIWVEKEKKGYWLLVDAKRNDPNTWLQNKDVLNLIAKLPSRHTLLITDACFSGGVFKTRSIGKDAPAAIQSLNEKISRVAITSGNDTEVPDESVFMKYLIKALSENKNKYLTAQKMFITQIMEAVMTETKTEPRYGTLELAGHVGGDYIFAKK